MDKEQNPQGAPEVPLEIADQQALVAPETPEQPTVPTEQPVETSLQNSIEQTAETPLSPSSAEPSPPDQSKKKKILASIIIVLVAVLVGIAAFVLLSKNDTTDKKYTSQESVNIAKVRVGSLEGPIGTDYLFPKPFGAELSMNINFQVFEGLIGFSDQKYVPLLATSWTNPDNNTWVFEIKQNVKFQNGKTLTALDVKKSLDALIKDESWSYYLPTIKEVNVTGQNQVTIKTIVPDSLLLNRLVYGFIYSENADKTVSGTGAYTVDAANSKTEDKTRIVAFSDYHQGKPKTQVVEYAVYNTPEDFNKALADGLIDIGKDIKDPELAVQLSSKNVATYNYDSTGAYGITINMTKSTSPLNKKEVREALAYAIDRNAYITAAKSSRVATNYIIPKTVVGFDEKAQFPETNITKAKELLTKAGYPGGVPLTFNYIDGIQADVPILAEQLNKAGFKVTAKSFPSPDELVAANKAAKYDLFTQSYSSDLNDGIDVFSGLLSSKSSQFPSYNNPAYDKLLLDAVQAFKPIEHVQKVQEVNRYTAENFLWIPVANRVYTTYYPKTYDYKVDSNTGLNGVYYWKLGAFASQNSSN